jgi:diacylglycerol kinase (ATP)
MSFKSIHIIINPASGKEEPILSYLNKAFLQSGIDWDVSVTKPNADVCELAKSLITKADVIAMYGGDGSVTEVARALQGSNTPLAIIAGGTANVTAKEFGLPQDSMEAITLLTGNQYKIIDVDMGLVNNKSFLLRINFGIMADMILDADRGLKDKLGQVAYGVTAIKTITSAEPQAYDMVIDGQKITESGVALTITNAGNIGIGDYSFLPDISVTDGYLDVILMNDTNLMSFVKLAGTTLFQTDSEVLKHWRCKNFSLTMPRAVKYIRDDCEAEDQHIDISIVPASLKVVVPVSYA